MIEWKGRVVSKNRMFMKVKCPPEGDGGIHLSKEYKSYRKSIENACKYAGVHSPSYVDLHIRASVRKELDTDNIFKGLCDGIQNAGLIIDDTYIRNIFCERQYIPEENREYDTLSFDLIPVK
jgi:Holliday junction resolvase RusA-like endonuclease